MAYSQFVLAMLGDQDEPTRLGIVDIDLSLATAIAGYKAIEHSRPIFVFEGEMIRRMVRPPDAEFLADLAAPRSLYAFGMRIRKVKAKGPFGPYTYSPWIQAEEYPSARSALAAFRDRKLKRTEEFQLTWAGEPVFSVGQFFKDCSRGPASTQNWAIRLEMLVTEYGEGSYRHAHLVEAMTGAPVLLKGRNRFAQGPRVRTDSFCFLPDDLTHLKPL